MERGVTAPYLSSTCRSGRPRNWPQREIIKAIFYVLRGGIFWRLLLREFLPWRTVYRRFAAWWDNGLFEEINHVPVMADQNEGC